MTTAPRSRTGRSSATSTSSSDAGCLGARPRAAWAAGSIFRIIAILCGVHATTDATGSRLYVDPVLPEWLPELTIWNLRAGNGRAGLRFHGRQVEVLANTTGFEIINGLAPRPTPWTSR